MSPVTRILCLCACALTCATLVNAGPINLTRSEYSIAQTEAASEISATKLFSTIDLSHESMKFPISNDASSGPLSKPILVPDLKKREAVPSIHKVKTRIRRSIMDNGKCSTGHVKIGKACMSCQDLGTC